MKREKLIIFIFALILLAGFVNAADNCELKTSCDTTKTLLYTYDLTNSHAVWTGSNSQANYALCCSFSGAKNCDSGGTNEILSLSSQSNAHIESPSSNNYNTKVCYGDLECIKATGSSPAYPIEMVSLSSETNAHIGKYSVYPIKIVCKHKQSSSTNPLVNSNISFVGNTNARLNLNPNQLGTSAAKVNITINNINATQGTQVSLNIYERDFSSGGARVIKEFDSKISFFNKIIQSLIQFTGKITGRVSSGSNNFVYTPIRTINGTLNAQKEVTFNWTINQSDINKAGTENIYDFVFESKMGSNVKKYTPLFNVKIISNGPSNKSKSWLDNNRRTKIITKSMNWSKLPLNNGGSNNEGVYVPPAGGNVGLPAGSTGGVITGNPTAGENAGNILLNHSLIYMNASGLIVGSNVSFEVWEKDTLEGGSDDPIRVGSNSISAIVDINSNAVASFYVNQEDINAMKSEDPINYVNNTAEYELYFKLKNSSGYISINEGESGLLKLKVIYPVGYGVVNPSFAELIQKWLDGNKVTVITKKTINWSLLIPPHSSENSIVIESSTLTGSTITGYASSGNYPNNLVYMNASGLIVGSTVLFEVWESDFGEDNSNDSIRTGMHATVATVNSEGNAVAPWYVLKNDIYNALSGDSFNSSGVGNFEFYYKVKYGNGSSNVYAPVKNFLNLQIVGYSSNIITISRLSNAQGIWANSEFNAGLTHYVYQTGTSNIVGMYVSEINPSSDDDDVYFEIWERDDDSANPGDSDGDDPIIIDNSLSSPVINGVANTTWTITSQNLLDAGNETYYEFYYKIRYLTESKSFRNVLLNVTINNSVSGNNTNNTGGGGGGAYCDDIFYCSDYLTSYKCNSDPCSDVLINEFDLNPEADCSNPNVNCYCLWSNGECGFSYSVISSVGVGECSYIQGEVQDDCENSGLMITPYEANWTWGAGNCYNYSSNCTDAITDPITESCLQKDGCWRRIDYSYENCTDYEDSIDCSSWTGTGGGDDEPLGEILKKSKDYYWWWILIIVGIIVVAVAIYFAMKKLKKGDIETRLFKTKENLNNILNYIKNARAQKMPDSEIRNSLLKVGWTQEQIAYAFKKSVK